MRRRDFIASLGALGVSSAGARAQQLGRIRTIGFLGANKPAIQKPWTDAFVQRLRELGYVDGQNVNIEYRWADGQAERSPELLTELLRLPVDVILTHATPNVLAAKKATSSVPIVFALAGDPVRNGIVTSLNRPGGNVTGLALQQAELAGKRLELLRELLPGVRRVGMLVTTANPNVAVEAAEMNGAARALGMDLISNDIAHPGDIAPALERLRGTAEALYVPTDPLTSTHRHAITSAAVPLRLPTLFSIREFVDAGGLVSYGPNFPDLFRRAADLVDKVLAGVKPGDLPVEQPLKFDLVMNLKTAGAVGVTIPPTLLARADDVIE
jgi:putative ABC transport system substrate-binding protein